MDRNFQQIRIIHAIFLMTWFLFLLQIKIVSPQERPIPIVFPAVMGILCISEIGLALFFRARYISAAVEVLRSDPANPTALAKWRMGNLLCFVFAETVTLFGLVLKFLGAGWNVAGIFFGVGLCLMLLWTPRPIKSGS